MPGRGSSGGPPAAPGSPALFSASLGQGRGETLPFSTAFGACWAGTTRAGTARCVWYAPERCATSCGIAERFANISVSFTGRVFFRLLKQAGKSSGRASAPVHSFPSPAVTALLLSITRQSGTGHSLVLPLPNFGKLTLPQEAGREQFGAAEADLLIRAEEKRMRELELSELTSRCSQWITESGILFMLFKDIFGANVSLGFIFI